MESYGFDVEDYTEWEGYQDVIDALGKRRLEDFALQNWSVSSQWDWNVHGDLIQRL